MLRELSIRNFAIIDDLQIRFSPGLTILSGETGAGKSIIINAVNLLLGSRASSKLIRTGADSAELEALFQIAAGSPAAETLADQGYEPEAELLIRRIISRSGQNRVYVNGRLATMQLLSALTEHQASISGQHAHQGLLREETHLDILDSFGGLMPVREETGRRYNELLPLIRRRSELEKRKIRQAERLDLIRFQQQEIRAAAVEPGEDEALESEKQRLKNAESLYGLVNDSVEHLYSSSGAVVEQLIGVRKRLEKAAGTDPGLSDRAEEIAAAAFQVEDVARELTAYLDTVRVDEARLEQVEERLDALHKLKRKYGGSLTAVLDRLSEIDRELGEEEGLSERIEETDRRIEALRQRLWEIADRLSDRRRQAAEALSKSVEAELASLKMEKTRFHAALTPISAGEATDPRLTFEGCAVSETGFDRVAFEIAPNVGEEMKPLSAIASGGELSRVVLALKIILSATRSVETVVFDEVDAGIGGSAAETVGKKLAELAGAHQVLCITHLPQIAKFGDHHFRISKQVAAGRTVTRITALNRKERVEELARMLGGEHITPTTLKHAQELIRKPA